MLGGPNFTSMVAQITSEEDKRIWARGSPSKCAQMAHSMTRGIDEVERAISEIVEGAEAASFDVVGELNLPQISSASQKSILPQEVALRQAYAKSLSRTGESGIAG